LAAALQGHESSVNCIAAAQRSNIFASGSADGTIKLWRIANENGIIDAALLQTIVVKPRFFALAMALRTLDVQSSGRPMVLAAGGTSNIIQIYVANDTTCEPQFQLRATLMGHESWIRSLAFTAVQQTQSQDFLLASASQDKYIRLWRVHPGEAQPTMRPNAVKSTFGTFEQTLSNKAHMFEASGEKYSVTFEALLFGHEDWIYTASWTPNLRKSRLLSASADSSLVIWEIDPVSGVWYSAARMGEISAQKGSTTATGSTGGFWIGLWSPNGEQVATLGRTGSWRLWKYDNDAEAWLQKIGVNGHVKSVNGIQWEPSGGYLLSTGSDQTTRLHAKWIQGDHGSWREFARPQIHGYDLNCISSLGASRFISGADEKLLRVFNETKSTAQLLDRLCGFRQSPEEEMPRSANIPVLGLSNKAVEEEELLNEADTEEFNETYTNPMTQAWPVDLNHPPLEDQLARHTLWPEHEKLYGHGYEISAVSASNDLSLVATACKASSIDHAVIRLYETESWNEVRPSLTAHSLTITCLCFSRDDRYLLSVGRDRQWVVFERDKADRMLFKLLTSNPKGHSRMILAASWAPLPTTRVFATAGRDKSVKIWVQERKSFVCKATISVPRPVTAIEFLPTVVDNNFCLAVGEDNGQISIYCLTVDKLEVGKCNYLSKLDCPSKAVTQLSWRPVGNSLGTEESNGHLGGNSDKKDIFELAAASEDSSVRIYIIGNLPP
jgi:elongator complex protein 2